MNLPLELNFIIIPNQEGLSGRVAKNKFGQGGKQQIKILKRNEKRLQKLFDRTKTQKCAIVSTFCDEFVFCWVKGSV
jgi:hypothetical protein